MKAFSFIINCAALILVSGCASMREGNQTVTKLESGVQISEKELSETGKAYFLQAVAAMEKGDHQKFTENYIPELQKRLSKDNFNAMAANFRSSHGKMLKVRYLGSINKFSGRILLWAAIFERTPAVNEQLKRAGHDPAKIPETESLVQMMLGKTEKGWKIIRMSVQ